MRITVLNVSSGNATSVSGGYRNSATHNYATVSGGADLTSTGNNTHEP